VENIFVAEMVGTAILIVLGCGVVANVLLTDSPATTVEWICL
jgi:glycerol uptake facilitator-like aquaporin